MTGWQALTGIMCPSWMAQYINRLNNNHGAPMFSGGLHRRFGQLLSIYDTATDQALCNKCWLDFLRGEVK